MLERLSGLIRYNKDWGRYLLHRYVTPKEGELITFRLRNGQTIVIRPDVRFTLNEIYLDRVYEIPGVDLASCRSVLDLGANMGIFALYVASNSPEATVHCFEPQSTNFEILQRNLSSNRVRAEAHRLAVSTSCGTGYLQLKSSAEHSLGDPSEASEAVECVDLDHVFAMARVERFDFAKMDIEGAEREILAQCTDTQLRRMCALSLEWHHSWDELEELARRLRASGFDARTQVVHGHGLYLKARLL